MILNSLIHFGQIHLFHSLNCVSPIILRHPFFVRDFIADGIVGALHLILKSPVLEDVEVLYLTRRILKNIDACSSKSDYQNMVQAGDYEKDYFEYM